MKKQFTEKDLVYFGNYLLSEKREQSIENKENINQVHDCDIANYIYPDSEISKAYVNYYDIFKKWIDKDGWFDGISLPTGAMGLIAQMTKEIPFDFDEDNLKQRPKTLNKKQPYLDTDF